MGWKRTGKGLGEWGNGACATPPRKSVPGALSTYFASPWRGGPRSISARPLMSTEAPRVNLEEHHPPQHTVVVHGTCPELQSTPPRMRTTWAIA
jgi:hypothetical protein